MRRTPRCAGPPRSAHCPQRPTRSAALGGGGLGVRPRSAPAELPLLCARIPPPPLRPPTPLTHPPIFFSPFPKSLIYFASLFRRARVTNEALEITSIINCANLFLLNKNNTYWRTQLALIKLDILIWKLCNRKQAFWSFFFPPFLLLERRSQPLGCFFSPWRIGNEKWRWEIRRC